MRPPAFSSDTVVATLQSLHVASMPQLVAALGAPSVRTVFRKLRQVDCLTSGAPGPGPDSSREETGGRMGAAEGVRQLSPLHSLVRMLQHQFGPESATLH